MRNVPFFPPLRPALAAAGLSKPSAAGASGRDRKSFTWSAGIASPCSSKVPKFGVRRERIPMCSRSSMPLLVALLLAVASGLRIPQQAPLMNRRTCLTGVLSAATLPLLGAPFAAEAAEEDIEVYFGCGCFWHVQHEFSEAERTILGRGDMDLTAYAGYAGGTRGTDNGKVCYHNALQIADYGKLGSAHARTKHDPDLF